MKKMLSALILVTFPIFAFGQNEDFRLEGVRVPKLPVNSLYEANDTRLHVRNGVTVNDLSRWARQGRIAELEDLFSNYSISMRCLPSGTSAGKAGQVLS